MTSSSSSTVDPTALAGDVDIFWLLFGAVMVFCESCCEYLFHAVELFLYPAQKNTESKMYCSLESPVSEMHLKRTIIKQESRLFGTPL